MQKKALRQLKTIIHNGIILDIIKDLGYEAWAMYSVIALHADWHTGISFPNHCTLTRLTGFKSVNTIKKYIKLLVNHGYLTDEYRKPQRIDGTPYGPKRHFYTLTWPSESEFIKPK